MFKEDQMNEYWIRKKRNGDQQEESEKDNSLSITIRPQSSGFIVPQTQSTDYDPSARGEW